MRDRLLATERVRAIQEEVAGFLLDEVIAPTGEYHRQYDFEKIVIEIILYICMNVYDVPLCNIFDQAR
jgi:hypothetical protein